MKRTRFTPNIYIERGDHYEMIIFSGEQRGAKPTGSCLISKDILPLVGCFKWGIDGRGYIRNRFIKIHQMIMGTRPNMEIDHINGIKTDNRTENLRHVTHKDNMRNMRKRENYGLVWDKTRLKWNVSFYVDSKCKYIGRYSSLSAARKQRDIAVKKYHRELKKPIYPGK